MRAGWRCAVVIAVALLAPACAPGEGGDTVPPSETATDEIRVGAFNFPESRLLGELYALALAGAGFSVGEVTQLGSREIVEPALEQGRIDVVPEYTGSALVFLERTRAAANSNSAQTHRAVVAAFQRRNVTVAAAAPAQNQNAIVVTEQTAREHGLRTVTDLRGVAEGMVLGGPPECPQRTACMVGLKDVYGLRFERFLSLERTDHVEAALNAGEIDVGVLFTTDPALLVNDFVALVDDRDLQPAENVVPVVRTPIVQRHGPKVIATLDEVSKALTTEELTRLNHDVEQDGISVRDAATSWLDAHGITP
jgi:osmoprotectant transport system substrate-binding protein